MVTQQRMSAARADTERETLRRLVQAATGTAIIATGKDGRIALFNPGAEAMLGYVAEEVVGELPDMFHPPEELRRQALTAARAARTSPTSAAPPSRPARATSCGASGASTARSAPCG